MYIKDWETHKKHLLGKKGFQKALEENRVEYEIAHALIEARIIKGLTQKELAEKINTKQSVISRLEGIQSTPSISLLKRIAQALNASLEIKLLPHQ